MPKKTERSPILVALREASQDERKAVEFFEARRWGSEPACPRCGDTSVYQMRTKGGDREKHYRWRCRGCKRMYSVRTGLVLEETRLPLRVWVHAYWRACSSKKGVSALQISRECEISYKSALFLMHRIRYAMAEDHTVGPKLSGIVEVDETYIGGKPRHRLRKKDPKTGKEYGEGHSYLKEVKSFRPKAPVVALVERGGRVRARHIERVDRETLGDAVREFVERGARLITDENRSYQHLRYRHPHETVNHSRYEYVRGDVTTNTVEGFFSLLKRGVYGTFHSVSKHHLHRYIAEFEFRYNHRKMDDGERTLAAIRGAEGKRLFFRQPIESP